MSGGTGEFVKLFELRIGAEMFAADWSHCDRISSYVADLLSHARTDSLRYANLFSSVLNELLETVFHHHAAMGSIRCAVSRAGTLDRIEISLPCDGATRAFYHAAMAEIAKPDVADRYLKTMLSGTGHSGLMELAVDYSAKLSVTDSAPGELHLTTELVLEE